MIKKYIALLSIILCICLNMQILAIWRNTRTLDTMPNEIQKNTEKYNTINDTNKPSLFQRFKNWLTPRDYIAEREKELTSSHPYYPVAEEIQMFEDIETATPFLPLEKSAQRDPSWYSSVTMHLGYPYDAPTYQEGVDRPGENFPGSRYYADPSLSTLDQKIRDAEKNLIYLARLKNYYLNDLKKVVEEKSKTTYPSTRTVYRAAQAPLKFLFPSIREKNLRQHLDDLKKYQQDIQNLERAKMREKYWDYIPLYE